MTTKNIQLTTPEDAMRRMAEAVAIACKYTAEVYLCTKNKRINAKSLMGMMSLLNGSEDNLTISAQGNDETQAVDELTTWLATI